MKLRYGDDTPKELQRINTNITKDSKEYPPGQSANDMMILNCSYIPPKMLNKPMCFKTISPVIRYLHRVEAFDFIDKHSDSKLETIGSYSFSDSNIEDNFSDSSTENDFNEKEVKEKSNDVNITESNEKKAKYENNEEEKDGYDKHNQNIFFDDENEFKIIEKIGEGASSIVYKVINKQSKQIMCKKTLKIKEETDFNDLHNCLKEFDALNNLKHPCICQLHGINMHEQVNNEFSDYEYDTEPITTVSLFIEYYPYKLSDCLKNKKLNNTQKVRIALEIAFGMSFIHNKGMMHRDLNIDNIMLNDSYEAKIIDFDHVRIDDIDSLTKEIINEIEYDKKCDVKSYGIILFGIFSDHMSNKSFKDRIANGQTIYFPDSMTKYCIKLIKRCTDFDPSNRPTFDEIINDIKKNSSKLAEGIDSNVINQIYQKLKNLKV